MNWDQRCDGGGVDREPPSIANVRLAVNRERGMQPSMGFYGRRVFPWLNDRLSADEELVRTRAKLMHHAKGRTLEIGFGTGLSLLQYPEAVSELVAVEPNEGMLDRAASRIEAARFPVRVLHTSAESLLLPDRHFDTAVSVLTLCSVREPSKAIAELHRVLRDGGRLLVLEHGLSEQPNVASWQKRLDWMQSKVACGCHLTRPITALLEHCGFRFERLQQFFMPTMPRTHGWITVAIAFKV
jgi:SAM-dependent methyltransferase